MISSLFICSQDRSPHGARTLDEVAQQLALGVPQLSVVLMMLEMKKAARRLPGNRYERC